MLQRAVEEARKIHDQRGLVPSANEKVRAVRVAGGKGSRQRILDAWEDYEPE
jgi:hypothetical protein